jgi:hypothetical protein
MTKRFNGIINLTNRNMKMASLISKDLVISMIHQYHFGIMEAYRFQMSDKEKQKE